MKTNTNQFEWCGYTWQGCMEGNRIIHPDQPWQWYSAGTIAPVEDNALELEVLMNPKKVDYYNGRTFTPMYEVATMRTVEDFDFGKFSCEIKLPEGTGMWPSFWLAGSGNWPPEIDIMEAWSRNSNYYVFPFSRRVTTNVYYNDEILHVCNIKLKNASIFNMKNPVNNFIKYEVEWLPDRITFKADGKVIREVKDHVCEKLTKNLNDKDKGYRMNVIIDAWCDDPGTYKIREKSPMVVKNFKYEKYGL